MKNVRYGWEIKNSGGFKAKKYLLKVPIRKKQMFFIFVIILYAFATNWIVNSY